MTLLAHDEDRYYRSPHLAPVRGGRALLTVIRSGAGSESVLAFEVDSELALGTPRTLVEADAILGLTRVEGTPAVSRDPLEPDRCEAGGWTVEVRRRGGRSSVVARSADGKETCVFEASGTAAAPCVAPTAGGAWVAFHHNVREDTGEPDLAKWIALRFVSDGGEVSEPALPMTGRDRDREGEEQGFEFPSLVVGDDGALLLFGRGSHAFFRQSISAEGFGERVPLGTTDWGCRGRWVAACRAGDHVLGARREKRGVELARFELPRGGAPALRPVVAQLESRAHRDVPSRPSSPDPARKDGRRTLFGDIHQHSAHSDGVGTADEPYLRARYVYGDDFCALTDHESFIGKRIGAGEWAYLCAVAEAHDEPGAFATLLAYEWTGRMYPGPGHKVVYLPPEGGPVVSKDDVKDGAELVRRVKAFGGFAVPHHVGWTGANEEAHDPEGQPVWEICSCHGCYLTADHPLGGRGDLRDQMVEAVMRRGRRFGFIACSDGHGLLYHHGVGRKRDPFRCGLTAVQATDCTREAILSAIRARRCYATSGVPILLDLRAGDAPMGSELAITGPVEVRAEVGSSTPLASLELVGPDGPIATRAGEGALDLTLEAWVGPGWVYAKAVREDGEMAWSSPIFLDPA